MQNKVAFIIPGFTESADMDKYQTIGQFFFERGVRPIPVQITWARTIISQNATSFIEQYHNHPADRKYVLGFSFGAMIAFIAATKVHFDAQILCSLSPYFQEDIPIIKKWWLDSVGKHRRDDFSHINSQVCAQQTNAKTFMLYGTKEHSDGKNRIKEVYKSLTVSKKLIPVHGAKHDIADEYYLSAIKKVIKTLS